MCLKSGRVQVRSTDGRLFFGQVVSVLFDASGEAPHRTFISVMHDGSRRVYTFLDSSVEPEEPLTALSQIGTPEGEP